MKFAFNALASIAILGGVSPAWGARDNWPAAPIRIVVPFAAGGATDILARVVGAQLQQRLGQSVVVENQTGAGGTIGAAAVAKSKPDGHTLLLGTVATQSISKSVYPSLSYKPTDFAPISTVATVPMVLTLHPSVPATDAKSLVEYSKKNPGTLDYGSSGNGAITHLAVELFKSMTGADMAHVPYRGSAPAVADLLAGRIKVMIDHAPTVLPHIESGKLKAIGVADPKPIQQLPNVPAIAASGVPGYEVTSWFGLLAPAGTPDAVIDKLNKELKEVLASPQVQKTLTEQGALAKHTSPDEFGKMIDADMAKWGKVVKDANVTLQ
ncbi:tripartite tricarboxylate transporter substrate binding protein [Bordetella sp. 15P40C-2]|uniref:Bug family tripartite tricarboxylate transporter substrate binding protein n=1 Tax=Bordetella sp. 15P40C-2 TaxID=2572246 RepID=UPI00132068D0|nr:tripartite tricarboxylate transporter substrate binding protein [Bordetella sp. 15P40C-2]MVW71187.1 tripartite tricarboxylate transporter substrate binding protein [Bordetella sp. 15P40C-2]